MTDFSLRNNRTIVLFDVDGTLTAPRGEATNEINEFIAKNKGWLELFKV